ncbi:uncharacterized protein V1516DRAFT_635017 [Lipomyces oligophaga]|uniref:uncharacterized protein n=1 Tax=Lipomyces oligophaga TaxID=45792 RepID=UPI0034CF4995
MTDPNMNVVWSMLVELTASLSANRESTDRLIRLAESVGSTSTAALTAATTASTSSISSDSEALDHESSVAEKLLDDPTSLANENARLRKELAAVRRDRDDLDVLVQQYEHTLGRIIQALREYATSRTEETIRLHDTYAQRIEDERNQYSALHSLYTDQQSRIQTLSDSLRKVYRLMLDSETSLDDKATADLCRVVHALTLENKGLRRILLGGSISLGNLSSG